MVQTKRPTLVSPAMGSRSNSTQVLPKKKHAAPSISQPRPSPPPPAPSALPANGLIKPSPLSQPILAPSPSPSPPSKVSKKKKRRAVEKAKSKPSPSRRPSFLPLFFLALAIYAYTAVVCPSDDLICKGNDALHARLLEPHVLPHIRAVRSDPRVGFVENRVLFPAYDQVTRPVYEKVALPFYRDTFLPFYDNTLHPQLRPYTRKAHLHMVRARRTAQPYVKRMWEFYDAALPHVQEGWVKVKSAYIYAEPYLLNGYHAALPYVQELYTRAIVLLELAKERSVSLRRLYVDPHVEKIWDTIIDDQGNAKDKV